MESAAWDDSALDAVDDRMDAWTRELPDLDPAIEGVRQRLWRLAHHLERGVARIAAQHQLSVGDWDALNVLVLAGPPYELSPTALAAALEVTSGTAAERIRRLTEAGLLETGTSTRDLRARPVRVTAEGERRWRAATAERLALERRLFCQVLDEPGLAQLNQRLRELLLGIEEGA
jgi:DNA-binding MarR family transcriptional regulator